MLESNRRGFLLGLGAALAAPAIVRADNIMPVRVLNPYYERCLTCYEPMSDSIILRIDRATFPLYIPPMGHGVVDLIPNADIGRVISRKILDRQVSPPSGTRWRVDLNVGSRYEDLKAHLASGSRRPFFEHCRA